MGGAVRKRIRRRRRRRRRGRERRLKGKWAVVDGAQWN
jgi:hypothetical protein